MLRPYRRRPAPNVVQNATPSHVQRTLKGYLDVEFANVQRDILGSAALGLGLYLILPGETGVVNPVYPQGDIRRYGAECDAATNDSAAVQLAIDAMAGVSNGVQGSCVVRFPAAATLMVDGVTIPRDGVRVRGLGKNISQVIFRPTVTGQICFDFNDPDPTITGILYQCGIDDLTIFSDETTLHKVAIRSCATSEWSCSNLVISGPFTGAGTSIGLQIQGHEAGRVSDVTSVADVPMTIEQNPKWASGFYDLDHWNFHNCYLLADGNPCVFVEDAVWMTNISFTGDHPWVHGTHGFYWDTAVDDATSHCITFENVRWEGAQSAGYMFYINAAVQALGIRSASTGTGTLNKGLYFRKTQHVSLDLVEYGGTIEALNVDDTVRDITAKNCFWQDNSTVSGIGYNQVSGVDISTSIPQENVLAPLPYNFHGESTLNANRGAYVSKLGVGNTAAATIPGSVVAKMEVFDATGASVGFVPIYDAIT